MAEEKVATGKHCTTRKTETPTTLTNPLTMPTADTKSMYPSDIHMMHEANPTKDSLPRKVLGRDDSTSQPTKTVGTENVNNKLQSEQHGTKAGCMEKEFHHPALGDKRDLSPVESSGSPSIYIASGSAALQLELVNEEILTSQDVGQPTKKFKLETTERSVHEESTNKQCK